MTDLEIIVIIIVVQYKVLMEGVYDQTQMRDLKPSKICLSVAVNGKRKAPSTVETSPSKKTKLINDGMNSE